MKKLFFVYLLIMCCLGCEEDEIIIDDNLIGVWESVTPFEINDSIPVYSIIHSSCGIDSINWSSDWELGPFLFEFSYPNNYIITTSNTHHFNDNNEVSIGTFFNEGNKIFFNGSFKQSLWMNNGDIMTTVNIENIQFHCDYNTTDSLLSVSEIIISTQFEINTGIQHQGSVHCTVLLNNSSVEYYINNHPLWLDDREYNKTN